MDTAKFCPHCGKRLNLKAVQGLCPECFLKVGLGSGKFEEGGGKERLVTKTVRFLPPSPQQLAPHFPQLEIISLIGQGGMGAVYKARQKQLDRLVALKILPTEVSDDPAFAERFTREARALARLSHRNIVAVHDFGQTGEFYYFIMEFIAGLTLREVMLQHKLAPEEALAIVPQICDALQYAHGQGVVHRDIKPENILVDKQGELKITDFGLAMLADATAGARRLTQAREVMGTPNYMAPEQVERPREVDHRADIYSLGVVFYEMLTGELPLGKFPPPSRKVHIDVRLDEVVLHALEKEPERRYQQAGEVKTAVETIVSSGEHPAESNADEALNDVAAKTAGSWKSVGPAGWTARILGLVGFLVIAFLILEEGFPPVWKQPSAVQVELAALLLMATGLLVGWRSEIWGAFLIADGWLTFLIAERGLPPVPFTAFLVIAVLYGYGWSKHRRTSSLHPGKRTVLAAVPVVAISIVIACLPTLISRSSQPGAEKQTVGDRTNASATSSSPSNAVLQVVSPVAKASMIPPVVIKTMPESGASDVDPELGEITVTFSSPMKDGSWSWSTLGEGTFPETTGEARYLADGRTCVLPVKLKPGKVYATWINSEQFHGFQDRVGQPALPYLLIFETRKKVELP